MVTDLSGMDIANLPQPPPGVPAPIRPGPAARHSRRVAVNILVLGVISILVFILLGDDLGFPILRKSHINSTRAEAINNIKQVALSLSEFESEYGRFPDATTAIQVRENTAPPFSLGDGSSNELFRQLIVGAGLKSEKPFYAAIKGARKPDDVMGDDAHALAKGECAFSYVEGLDSSADPGTPLVMTPMIPGTLTFDPKPFDGKAIILFSGGLIRSITLDKAGHALDGTGGDLFDSRQPYWHGKPPVVKWPL